MKLPRLSLSQKWISFLITAAVIGAGFAYYFLYYVAENKREFDARAYQKLAQISKNFESKQKNYQKFSSSLASELEERFNWDNIDLAFLRGKNELFALAKQVKRKTQSLNRYNDAIIKLDRRRQSYIRRYSDLKEDTLIGAIDSLAFEIDELREQRNATALELKKANNLLSQRQKQLITDSIKEFTSSEKISAELSSTESSTGITELSSQISNTNQYEVQLISGNLYLNEFGIKINSIDASGTKTDSTTWFIKLKSSFNDFVKPLLTAGFFHEYILLRGSDPEIEYQTFSNKVRLTKATVDSTSRQQTVVINMSSLDSLQSGKTAFSPLRSKLLVNDKLISDESSPLIVGNTTYRTYNFSFQFANDTFLLIGCVKQSTFNQQVRSIGVWMILFTLLGILLIVVSIPLLKLALMSSYERLHIKNVFLTGVSIVLGTPILILFYLIIFNYAIHEKTEINDHLCILSNSLTQNFETEIDQLYQQLAYYDSALYEIDTLNTNTLYQMEGLVHNIYPAFDELFWLNEEGKQIMVYTSAFWKFSSAIKDIDLSERSYFQDIKNQNYWTTPNHSYKYALQPIISWTSGESEVVLSKPSLGGPLRNKEDSSDVAKVVAISSKMRSVMDVIVPLGFGFAIVDADGRVFFHSDESKINQEDFNSETNANPIIASAILGHAGVITTGSYGGESHRMLVTPLEGTALNLVVFSDLKFMKDRISSTWIFSFFVICISFLMAGLVIVAMIIHQKKDNKLSIKKFYFSWMNPKPKPKHKDYYIRMIVSNLLAILLISILMTYVQPDKIHGIFRISLIPALVLALTYSIFLKEIKGSTDRTKYLGLVWFFFILVNVLHGILIGYKYYQANGDINSIEADLTFQAWLILIYQFKYEVWIKYQVKRFRQMKFEGFPWNKMTWLTQRMKPLQSYDVDWKKLYRTYLFSWLFCTSFLPIFFIYSISYRVDAELWAKSELFDYVKKIDQSEKELDETTERFEERLRTLFEGVPENATTVDSILQTFDSLETQGRYPITISAADDSIKLYLEAGSPYNSLLFYGRPDMNDSIAKYNSLIYHRAFDGLFKWREKDADRVSYLGMEYKSTRDTTYQFREKIDDIEFNPFRSKRPDQATAIIFISSLFALALYQIIRFASNHIYGARRTFLNKGIPPTAQEVQNILDNKSLILIGTAHSGRTEFIKQALDSSKKYKNVDLMMINHQALWRQIEDETLGEETELVILDNFEYDINDHQVNAKKLRLIEKLVHRKTKIIIVTEVHPKEIIDTYRDLIKNTADVDRSEEYQRDLQVWRHILSSFVELYMPLLRAGGYKSLKHSKAKPFIAEEVNRELCYGSYLFQLQHLFIGNRERIKAMTSKDDVILEIQEFAKPYYIALWNTLSLEERYVVYDLAMDGYVNMKNETVIVALLRKGILRYNHTLKVFNKSFANYVLDSNKEEALEMEQIEKTKGNWSTIQMVLLLIVLGLVVLVFFAKPSFFKSINSIFLALTSVIGVLPSLGGLFALSRNVRPQ